MLTDGSTGGSHGLAMETVKARLTYLSMNTLFILANLLTGYVVYERTRSLTIEVDYLSFSCELLAVTINIVIEIVKRSSPASTKRVVVLDVVGGLSSLALLVCVGLFGVYSAVSTTKELEEGKTSAPTSLNMMLMYSAFSLVLSVVNLSIFAWLKDSMLPEGGDVRDELNIKSNLAHSLVDFVTNFAVLCTSLWLQYGVEEKTWVEMRKHTAWVDVFGSFVICACILVSIIWLMRDISQSFEWIREMPADEECAPEASGGKALAGAPSDYGTLEGVTKAGAAELATP